MRGLAKYFLLLTVLPLSLIAKPSDVSPEVSLTVYTLVSQGKAGPNPGGFAFVDLDGDSVDDIVFEDCDEKLFTAYSLGKGCRPINVDSLVTDGAARDRLRGSMLLLFYLLPNIQLTGDPTLTQPPMPVIRADLAKNRFTCVAHDRSENVELPVPDDYMYMLFKHHCGSIKLAGLKGDRCTYRLAVPSDIKTMFRGYRDDEVAPAIVTGEYFENHTPWPYTRWKHPEAVRPLSPSQIDAIAEYYDREVANGRWLATIENDAATADELLMVHFVDYGNNQLSALVHMVDGEVMSTLNIFGGYSDDPDCVPEIMVVSRVTDRTGKHWELCVRDAGLHRYSVWRELGNTWIEVQSQYLHE